MQVLEPNIIIIQGKGLLKWVFPCFKKIKPIIKNVLYKGRINHSNAFIAAFSHPSARGKYRWDNPQSPYLLNIVLPTIRRIHHEVYQNEKGDAEKKSKYGTGTFITKKLI